MKVVVTLEIQVDVDVWAGELMPTVPAAHRDHDVRSDVKSYVRNMIRFSGASVEGGITDVVLR